MKVVYAKVNTVVIRDGGIGVTISAGEHWPKSDPVVKDYPSLFTDDPAEVGLRISVPLEDQVEQTTAAPGEKRQTRKRTDSK